MARLTKRTVDALVVTGREYFIWDDEMPGFGVRVLPSGRKSYVVQYKVGGRGGETRRKSLGLHGVLTAEEARNDAKGWLAGRARGKDPIAEHVANRKSETVEQLSRRYLEAAEKNLILGKRGQPKKPSTLATDRGRIERHIIPLLGKKKVRELSCADIARFIREVTQGKTAIDERTGPYGRAIVKGGAGTAARTAGLLSGIMAFAVQDGLRPDNPCHGVRKPAAGTRERRLDPDDYRALGEALNEFVITGGSPLADAMVRVLALTGMRLGEVLKLRCTEIDRRGQALRLGDTKTGSSIRPLSSPALAVLDGVPTRADSPFAFPSPRGNGPYLGLRNAFRRLTRAGDGLTLKNEKQKDGEEAKPISLELARVNLPDGKTSRVVRGTKGSAFGAPPIEPRKDPRIVATDAHSLQALAAFGPEGATLSQWEKAVDRSNDTFYKSRDRLVEAGKVIHDKENARYVAAEPKPSPGPELVQNGSNRLEVQKVSPEVPL
jgi:integrase